MMINPHRIVRESAWPVPVVALVSGWSGGAAFGASVLVSGLFALANLAALAFIVDRLSRSIAADKPAGAAGAALVFKMVFALAGFGALMWAFGPLPVALGLASLMGGVSMLPVIDVLKLPESEATDVVQES